jgi:hypothetical protein
MYSVLVLTGVFKFLLSLGVLSQNIFETLVYILK